MKFRCPKCGTIFEEGVAACPGCGQPFKWPTKQEAPATVPAEEKVEEKVEEKIEEKVKEKPKKEKKKMFIFRIIRKNYSINDTKNKK